MRKETDNDTGLGLDRVRKAVGWPFFWLFIILSVTLVISIVDVASPDYQQTKSQELYSSEVDMSKITTYGLAVSENHFISTNNDPQIYIPCVDVPINTITIEFSTPFSSQSSYQVYFATNNEVLCEPNSVGGNIDYYSSSLSIHLDKKVYTTLRVDISGEYSIDNIKLQLLNVKEEQIVDVVAWIFVLISAIGLLLIFLFFRRAIKDALIQAKEKINSITDLNVELIYAKGNHHKIFSVIAIISGLMYIFLSPPMSHPDEQFHFVHTIRIASGDFFATEEDGKLGEYIPSNDMQFFLDNHARYISGAGEYSYGRLLELDNNRASEQKLSITYLSPSVNPFSYVIPALGMKLITLFDVNSSFGKVIAGEVMNLLFSVFIISLAIKKTPVLKNTMMLLGLMPMTLYQLASLSYDVPCICGSFLLFSYICKLVYSDNNYKVGAEDIISICLASALLFSSKIIYVMFLVILFSISKKKFVNNKQYIFCIASVVFTGIVFYLVPTMYYTLLLSDGGATTSGGNASSFIQLIANIKNVPAIIRDSTKEFGNFWMRSFIGYFGWLDAPFHSAYYALFIMAAGPVALVDISTVRGTKWTVRVLSAISTISVIVMVIMSMYLGHNPVVGIEGGTVAYGVQGRYFIPLSLFILMPLFNPLLLKLNHLGKVISAQRNLVIITSVFFSMMTCMTLLGRYWI